MSVCGICVGAPALLVGVERMGGGARGGVHRWVGWWVRGCALWASGAPACLWAHAWTGGLAGCGAGGGRVLGLLVVDVWWPVWGE